MAKDPNAAERERQREQRRAQLACGSDPVDITVVSKRSNQDGTANVRTKTVHCNRPKNHEGQCMWTSPGGDQMVKWPAS